MHILVWFLFLARFVLVVFAAVLMGMVRFVFCTSPTKRMGTFSLLRRRNGHLHPHAKLSMTCPYNSLGILSEARTLRRKPLTHTQCAATIFWMPSAALRWCG